VIYRVFITQGDRSVAVSELDFATDDEALGEARRCRRGKAVEVWQGMRRIGTIRAAPKRTKPVK
jgi:hypothetical protein